MASLQAAAPLPGLAGLAGARTTGGAVVRGSGRAARGVGAGAGSAGTGCTAGGLAGMDAAGAGAGAGSGTLAMGAVLGCASTGVWRCSEIGYIRSGKASISSASAINNNSENSQSLTPQSGRVLATGAGGAIERLAEIE